MPIYSYKCEKCGKIFDEFKKLDENNGSSNTKCIYCGSNALRLFSSVGIIFKGSGFYSTDYKSKSGSMNLNNGGLPGTGDKESKKQESKKPETRTPDKNEAGKKETGTVPVKPAES